MYPKFRVSLIARKAQLIFHDKRLNFISSLFSCVYSNKAINNYHNDACMYNNIVIYNRL